MRMKKERRSSAWIGYMPMQSLQQFGWADITDYTNQNGVEEANLMTASIVVRLRRLSNTFHSQTGGEPFSD
jgi:hypothetical protein